MKNKHGFTLIEILIVIAIVGILTAIVVGGGGQGGCRSEDGIHHGIITKFSNGGVIFNTYEGQMVMGGSVGNQVNTWNFSVRQDNPNRSDLADALDEKVKLGEPVTVQYHKSCWTWPKIAGTTYDIIRIIKEKKDAKQETN